MVYGAKDPTGNGLFAPVRSAKVVQRAPTFKQLVASLPAPVAKWVLVPGILVADVEQTYEPTNDPDKVSQDPRTATSGTIALAAHGRAEFSELRRGHLVSVLVAGEPACRHYKVSELWRFEVLADPLRSSKWSIEHNAEYKNLTDGTTHSTAKLVDYFYKGDRVVFNTCITRPNNPMWGRLFVVADRI